MMPIKVALVGCGELAASYYMPALQKLEKENRLRFVACLDVDAVKSKAFAKAFSGARAFGDADAMMQQAAPDCILLATPVEKTAEIAAQYSRYGVPLMIEKPPALTVLQAEQLAQQLKSSGIIHQVAFNRHYMPLVEELRSALSNEQGKIQNIQILMSRCNRLADNFYTTAIHSIDLAQHLACSPYKSARVTYQNLKSYGAGVNNYYLDCLFENEITAQITVLVCSGMVCERIMVTGDDKSWFLKLPVWGCSDTPGSLAFYQKDMLVHTVEGSQLCDCNEPAVLNGFYQEIKSFLQAIRMRAQPAETMDSAIESIRIAELIKDKKTSWSK